MIFYIASNCNFFTLGITTKISYRYPLSTFTKNVGQAYINNALNLIIVYDSMLFGSAECKHLDDIIPLLKAGSRIYFIRGGGEVSVFLRNIPPESYGKFVISDLHPTHIIHTGVGINTDLLAYTKNITSLTKNEEIALIHCINGYGVPLSSKLLGVASKQVSFLRRTAMRKLNLKTMQEILLYFPHIRKFREK